MNIYGEQTYGRSVDFLTAATKACPVKIVRLLTDNGSQFKDRFTSKSRRKESSDRIPPRHPQTNEMVERFNGHISEIVGQMWFEFVVELESRLCNYLMQSNHNIRSMLNKDARFIH